MKGKETREKNKKLWYIQSKKLEELTELEEFIKKQEKKLPTSSKEFSKKTLTEKSNEIKFLFSIYEASLSFNTIMFSLGKTPKKEFDQYQSLMSRFLNVNMKIWKNDKDAKHLFSELMLSLMKTSPFFADMLKVLDESRKINWGYDNKSYFRYNYPVTVLVMSSICSHKQGAFYFYSLSINSLAFGGSGLKPFLFLISVTSSPTSDFGIGDHDLKKVFQIAFPAV